MNPEAIVTPSFFWALIMGRYCAPMDFLPDMVAPPGRLRAAQAARSVRAYFLANSYDAPSRYTKHQVTRHAINTFLVA